MTADKLLARARRHYDSGNLTAAETACRQALKKDPSNPKAHYKLGCIYHARGNGARSIEAFQAAIALDPDRAIGRERG